MAGAALGFICIALLIVIPVALLIAAAVLMGGVAIANKCLPPRSRYDDYDDYDDYGDDWDEERPRRSRKRIAKTAIPAPPLGRALVIAIVNGIINFVVNKVFEVAMLGAGANNLPIFIAILAINLAIGFLINAGIRTAMLPTTFPRACLVVLFEILIYIAITIVIVVPIALIAGIAGAGLR